MYVFYIFIYIIYIYLHLSTSFNKKKGNYNRLRLCEFWLKNPSYYVCNWCWNSFIFHAPSIILTTAFRSRKQKSFSFAFSLMHAHLKLSANRKLKLYHFSTSKFLTFLIPSNREVSLLLGLVPRGLLFMPWTLSTPRAIIWKHIQQSSYNSAFV